MKAIFLSSLLGFIVSAAILGIGLLEKGAPLASMFIFTGLMLLFGINVLYSGSQLERGVS